MGNEIVIPEANSIDAPPCIVAAIGGSGTRLVANILLEHNFYLGGCFNRALDNLWFNYLMTGVAPFSGSLEASRRLSLFIKRMYAPAAWSAKDIQEVNSVRNALIEEGIDVDGMNNYKLPYITLTRIPNEPELRRPGRIGWKLPWSYLFADEIFKLLPEAKMLFVMRNPLDLVYSRNQNQLMRFGKYFGFDSNQVSPGSRLSFYLAVFDYVLSISRKYRISIVKFEDIIQYTEQTISEIGDFFKLNFDSNRVRALVTDPGTIGRYKKFPIHNFDNTDLSRLKKFGYEPDI